MLLKYIVQPSKHTQTHTYRSSVMITLSLYCRLNVNHSESSLLEYNSFPRRRRRKKDTQKVARATDDDIRPLDFAVPFAHVEP